ncbi:MAG: ABC transporter substrate-binding protein [bacterium]|nr:ABC transporter substrate-binding protein [bacterium]
MKTHTCTHALIVVFTAIFTLIMSGMLAPGETAQSEPVKLKVLLLPYLSFAPFFIAQEEGYFAEQGLEIEFVKIGGGSAKTIPALIQGQLDVLAGAASFSMFNAMVRGGEIKFVADKGHISSATECPANAFLITRELDETGDFGKPMRLQNLRIVARVEGVDGYLLQQALNKVGLTFDDVSIKYLPSPARSDALRTGVVDIVQASEPWLSRILRTGYAAMWAAANEAMPEFQYAGILYGPNLLSENQDVGQRFIVAYLRAVWQYNLGKTRRNVEILSKYTKLEHELLQEMCWPAIHQDGHINTQSLLDFQHWGLEKGWLDSIVTENRFWDPRFIEYANRKVK